jgi:zinc ribbon protein
MALISCPECGNEVSDKAPTCPKCGAPIHVESKVVVYGYTQPFGINPKVSVFWNGTQIGQVAQGGRLDHQISQNGQILLKCNMRKAKVDVESGRVTNIKIAWNRLTGKMVAQVVDVVTPEF